MSKYPPLYITPDGTPVQHPFISLALLSSYSSLRLVRLTLISYYNPSMIMIKSKFLNKSQLPL